MYCTNCGKQIEDGSRFCKYCGSAQGNQPPLKGQGTYSGRQTSAGMSEAFPGNLTAIDWCTVILYGILIIRWIAVFFGNLKLTWSIFGIVDSDMRLLLMMVYILPFVLVMLLCAIGILNIKNQEYHMSIGAILAVIGLLLKIGAVIFDTYSISAVKLMVFQIFRVYGSIGIFTIIFSVIIGIFLYTKTSARRG